MLTNVLMLARRIAKDDTPTEGVFYMVRVPYGWKLMAYYFDGIFGRRRIGHSLFWQSEMVPILAHLWAGALAKDAKMRKLHEMVLKRRLHGLVYAFPRGRIVKQHERYIVLFGHDLTNRMPPKDKVELLFGIRRKCDWNFNLKMRCKENEVHKIKRLLGLPDSWGD